MQTKSQKALKILSIIVIVIAILGTIAGVAAIFFGGTFMWTGVEVSEMGGIEDLSGEDAELLAGGAFIALMLGIVMVISGIVDIIVGILGLGVAKNGRRIKLYIGLCIFGLVMCAIGIISTIAEGMFSISSLISPIVMGLALHFALDIKKSMEA